jgi:hypothetical protein
MNHKDAKAQRGCTTYAEWKPDGRIIERFKVIEFKINLVGTIASDKIFVLRGSSFGVERMVASHHHAYRAYTHHLAARSFFLCRYSYALYPARTFFTYSLVSWYGILSMNSSSAMREFFFTH